MQQNTLWHFGHQAVVAFGIPFKGRTFDMVKTTAAVDMREFGRFVLTVLQPLSANL
jgi:hypothetical protein